MKTNLKLAILFLFIIPSAYATQECDLQAISINNDNLPYYKMLTQKSLSQKISLKEIHIIKVLNESEWVAIFMLTEISDPGVIFLKNNNFIDVWGGEVFPEDKASVLSWAKKIHMPDKLAHCFFESVVIK
ncbi:hypothetical protein [Enterobacter bugandensis]|uniref:hypothetical protein n=1 Tax=Enterobacter bugandensis TaxID=881260 RepID=UPI002003C351|nr:hypothetical protein [Enterobacter bugandensis]MCK6964546.1 hypothetical protein [Enterobacter bugandensis]